MEFNPNDMQKLAELLRPPPEESAAVQPQGWGVSDDLPKTGYSISATRDSKTNEKDDKNPKSIEDFEEQASGEAEEEASGVDGLKVPEYTMHYQQAVSAEDVYLQMGPKTPGSASCERLVVRVRMPGDKREHVQLDVQPTLVSVRSARHSLRLPLPHAADPDASRASWDSAQCVLELSLKLEREFDYVNF